MRLPEKSRARSGSAGHVDGCFSRTAISCPGDDLERRNIHLAACNQNMTVAHELPSCRAGGRETQPVNYVVKSSLEHLEQGFTRHPLPAARFSK